MARWGNATFRASAKLHELDGGLMSRLVSRTLTERKRECRSRVSRRGSPSSDASDDNPGICGFRCHFGPFL